MKKEGIDPMKEVINDLIQGNMSETKGMRMIQMVLIFRPEAVEQANIWLGTAVVATAVIKLRSWTNYDRTIILMTTH